MNASTRPMSQATTEKVHANVLRAAPDHIAVIDAAPQGTLLNENTRQVVSVRRERLNLSSWEWWCCVR